MIWSGDNWVGGYDYCEAIERWKKQWADWFAAAQKAGLFEEVWR